MPIMGAYGTLAARASRPGTRARPQWRFDPSFGVGATYTLGNLRGAIPSASAVGLRSTIGKSAGKWYAEVIPNPITGNSNPGIWNENGINGIGWNTPDMWALLPGGQVFNGNAPASGSPSTPWSPGDVVGIAFDATAKKVWFSRNGVWFNNPAAGTGGISISGTTFYAGGSLWAAAGDALTIPSFVRYPKPAGFSYL